MNKYHELCKQHIIDTLPDYEGETVEACDLGHDLTDSENVNGSWYCSTYKAEQDLDSFGRSIVAEFLQDYESEFGGKPQWDAFTDPENFHCLMMIIGVEKMLNDTQTIQDAWNKKIKLTKKVIKQIISEL
jgi:hypothetical protein